MQLCGYRFFHLHCIDASEVDPANLLTCALACLTAGFPFGIIFWTFGFLFFKRFLKHLFFLK
jgi:hypothetical protein